MSKLYIGVDNGTSGSIGLLGLYTPDFLRPPVKEEQDYTKAVNRITRINNPALVDLLGTFLDSHRELNGPGAGVLAVLERPMVNPGMFKTTGRALRALESWLIAIEHHGIPYQFCDSRGWQKLLLPEGLKGAPELKRASREVGTRLFPTLAERFKKQGDADGILIAEWARRTGL